jgi:hypothetical protein
MQGEQQRRMYEKKHMPRLDADGDVAGEGERPTKRVGRLEKRQSEMPISCRGMNQESEHHKRKAV